MIVFLILLTIHLLNELYTPNEQYDIAIAPLVGAALISGAAGLLNGVMNRNSQETYNDRMIRLQRETNQMNYMMNRENNAYNSMLAKEMFNLENEYNDPKNQMARLKAAGINPFVAAGGSNIGQVEGRADTIPAQSPLPMQNPAQGTVAPQLDFATPMAQIAGAFASLAQAKKAGMDTKIQEDAYNDILRAYKADADYKEATARQAEMDKIIKWLYGFDSARLQVKNLEKDLLVKDVNISEGEAHAKLLNIQSDISAIEKELKGEELSKFREVKPFLIKLAQLEVENAKKQGHVLDTQAASNIASANASNAAAEKDRALAETERQIRKFKVALADNQNTELFHKAGIARKDYEKSVATYQQAVDRADYENQLVLLTIDQVSEQVGLLLKDNKYYEVKMLLDASSQMINSLSKLK